MVVKNFINSTSTWLFRKCYTYMYVAITVCKTKIFLIFRESIFQRNMTFIKLLIHIRRIWILTIYLSGALLENKYLKVFDIIVHTYTHIYYAL